MPRADSTSPTPRRATVTAAVLILAALTTLAARTTPAADAPSNRPADGLRQNVPSVYALINARIVVAPGRTIEKGTVVVRDGTIEAAAATAQPPADARVLDFAGKTIYAGLIDAYAETNVAPPTGGAKHWNDNITPQSDVAATYQADEKLNKTLRSQGIAARLAVPSAGIIKGTAAVVTTGDGETGAAILRSSVAMQAQLTVSRRGRGAADYPGSPMGALTLVRQTLYDTQWYQSAHKAAAADSRLPRPERNDALAALEPVVDGKLPIIFDASNELYFLRADRVAREFGLRAIVRGSGQEYQRLDAIAATGRPVLLPVAFPRAPDVATPEAAMSATLERLLHWDIAPENPGRLDRAGVTIALSTYGLRDAGTFLKNVRRAVERGLSSESALRALTTAPAKLFGVDNRLGTVEAGKTASFVITDGDLFAAKTKILETWVDGTRYEIKTPAPLDVRGTWTVKLETTDAPPQEGQLLLAGEPEKLKGRLVLGDKQVDLKSVAVDEGRLAIVFKSDDFGHAGIARATGVVSIAADQGGTLGPGNGLWPDGVAFAISARRTSTDVPKLDAKQKPDDKQDDAKKDAAKDDKSDEKSEEKSDGDKNSDEETSPKQAAFAVNYPLGAYGRENPPEQPKVVVLRGATIWTSGPQGTLENASIILREGKIEAVGQNLPTPDGATVIDVAGRHVTAGMIDCHSHIATDGGINEGTQAITAEVRIGDFIDANDINIYRQLAGGITTSNILHGSANPIGGQNQVIKMRWSALPEDIKFATAPQGIKFALGENVKQSNWGENFRSRYPQTRLGVEQIMRDEFLAARQYRDRHADWKKNHTGLPPRIDLELEAIVEILEGRRWIHCHSYRQDEILALLRVCEEFHVQIATLQHILEGYKVTADIARHGAGGSSFSDWWAYKFEVIDAIPYNGALLHRAGIVTSFNSDDAELGRRMNAEAAKAIKYGGVAPDEALKFVTLNPAQQLRIDDRVGSLEPGKDADLVVWSASPLSSYSRCEQTWIDGRKYFDLAEEAEQRQRDAHIRNTLVQRILTSGADMLPPGEQDQLEEDLWPRTDIYCRCRTGTQP
ncbi:MAG: amidohydrolase family protein [Pirellulales bacterium]